MKIHFSPYYENGVYDVVEGCRMSEIVVGESGLLSQLELRLGLTGTNNSTPCRMIAYARAMQEVEGEAFFCESFKRDRYGTALVLLRWRDSMVRYGWKNVASQISNDLTTKLGGLAAIESHFDCPGIADRWRNVIDSVTDNAFALSSLEIDVRVAEQELDPMLIQLFSLLASQGVSITYAEPPAAMPAVNKVKLHRFSNEYEATQWFANTPTNPNILAVGFDPVTLNSVLARNNEPTIKSQCSGIGSLMQIVPLGLSLFETVPNPTTLLAYLQLPKSPLRSVFVRRTRRNGEEYRISFSNALADALISSGGLGTEWNDLIEGELCDYEGRTTLSQNQKEKILTFIEQWEKVGDDGKVDKNTVIDYLQALHSWSLQNINPNDNYEEQMHAICDTCDIMTEILNDADSRVSSDELAQWEALACQPIQLNKQNAEEGCRWLCPSPAAIYSSPKVLYWMASSTANTDPNELEFLSPQDIIKLQQQGLSFPIAETSVSARHAAEQRGLLLVDGDIHVILCDSLEGQSSSESPLVSNLVNGINSDRPDWQESATKTATSGKSLTPQETIIIPQELLSSLDTPISESGLRRNQESFSSLNTLIQYPLDYVMDYLLHLPQYGTAAMDDINTVRGNVAHTYIECLTNLCDKNVEEMRETHKRNFKPLISKIIKEHGILLHRTENRIEAAKFENLLHQSVGTLLDIIKENRLSIVASEGNYEATFDKIGPMVAKVDFLLRNEAGEYLVFDFKWSDSIHSYENKIKENRALQLAVYKEIIRQSLDGPIVMAGYYQLPRRKLYTSYSEFRNNSDIEVVTDIANTNDIFLQAANSYEYRINQLRSGIIEEASGLELANLKYVQDTPSLNLYPLESDYNNKEIKATAYGNKNIIIKGGLQ